MKPSYDDLRQAVLAARGDNLMVGLIQSDCMQALVELGVLVHIGGGMMETTSHGDRLHRRLQRGERIAELEPT